MEKRIYDKSGMKQIINSGWKEFDKQTNLICTGNAYCNTQFSNCIRSYNQTECNGFSNPKGDLLNFDLKPFAKYRIPRTILDIIEDKDRNEGLILYMFFTSKNGHIEPFCWAVTDYNYKLVNYSIVCGYKQNYFKRYSAAKEAIKYIAA